MAALQPGELLSLCVECYDSFSPTRMALSSHVEDFVETVHPELSASPEAAAFVSDVVLSLERLHPFLSLTVDGLYAVHSSDISRHERSRYLVFALLCLDKLPLMAWEDFTAFAASASPLLLHPLLSFLFDERWQAEWMREQWQTVYDLPYVDSLLQRLRSFLPQMQPLIDRMARSCAQQPTSEEGEGEGRGAGVPAVVAKAATVPQPFALSQGRVKVLPLPLALPSRYAANPVPRVLGQRSLAAVEEEKRARKERLRAELVASHAQDVAFHLFAAQRPCTLAKAVAAEEERLKAATAQRTFVHPPAPVAPASTAPHRTTAASVLRDEALYRRSREEAAARLLRLSQELRDTAAFDSWQAARRAEDDERRKEEVARRKTEMARSHVEAQQSVAALVHSKTQQALQWKEEGQQRRAERQRVEGEEAKRREDRARALSQAEEAAVAAAQSAALQRRRETAKAVAAEKAEMAELRRRRAEDERREKRRLMRRIQAMEKEAGEKAKRGKVVEDSRSGGLSLLSDMSVAEMKARLALLEEREAAALQRKRERIDAERKGREQVLRAMEEEHAALRGRARVQKEGARDEARARRQRSEAAVADRVAVEEREVQRRLLEKRQRQVEEALALAQALQSNRAATQRLRSAAEAGRSRMERDMEEAEKRREAEEARQTAAAEKVDGEVETRKAEDLDRFRRAQRAEVRELREAAERRLREAREESKERWEGELQAAHSSVARVRAQREKVREATKAANPTAVEVSAEDIRRAAATAQRRKEAELRWKAAERARLQRQLGRAHQRTTAEEADAEATIAAPITVPEDTLSLPG